MKFDPQKIIYGDISRGEPIGLATEAENRNNRGNHEGVYITDPEMEKMRIQFVTDDVIEAFGKYFYDPGTPEQLESLRKLIAQYAKCPENWLEISADEEGYHIIVKPDIPIESVSMEVII